VRAEHRLGADGEKSGPGQRAEGSPPKPPAMDAHSGAVLRGPQRFTRIRNTSGSTTIEVAMKNMKASR